MGGQAGSSRRIENYLGFPAGISGTELTSRAVSQARKFGARPATPYRAVELEPGNGRHVVRLEEGQEIAARAVVLATGASYRRLPLDDLADYEGVSVFYAAGPPEAQLVWRLACCRRRRRQLRRASRRLARPRGALVTLIHRRADLGETMSDYLIHELDRYGVAVRDRGEIAALHGANGQLEAVTLKSGEQLPFSCTLLLPRRRTVHRMAERRRRARSRRLHPHRRHRRGRQLARDKRAWHLRSRRRPVRVQQTVRSSRGRRIDGGAVRPPTSCTPDCSSPMSEGGFLGPDLRIPSPLQPSAVSPS